MKKAYNTFKLNVLQNSGPFNCNSPTTKLFFQFYNLVADSVNIMVMLFKNTNIPYHPNFPGNNNMQSIEGFTIFIPLKNIMIKIFSLPKLRNVKNKTNLFPDFNCKTATSQLMINRLGVLLGKNTKTWPIPTLFY